jgi:hypothetical protein
MERPQTFEGPLIPDLLQWAGGGLLAGGVFGFLVAEVFSRLYRRLSLEEILRVANRDAYRGAVFFGLVGLVGHLLRAIF